MKEIYFTVVIYVDNDELLRKSIEGIYNVSDGFEERIKIIVIDPICSDTSVETCEAYTGKMDKSRFLYVQAKGVSIGDAYNMSIPKIRGRYVNFSLASISFQMGTLEMLYIVAEELGRPKLVSLSPWTINEKDEYLPYKMSPKVQDTKYVQISLNQNPAKLQLLFHAYFIRCYLMNSKERGMAFRPELHGDAVMEMLMNLLAEFRNYLYMPKIRLNYTVQLEDNTSAFLEQHYEWWYVDSMKNWILPFAQKWAEKDWPLRIPMRIALLYIVFARYNCNYNDRNKGILKGESLEEFAQLTGEVLQYIDNELIWKKNVDQTFIIPRTMKMLFLRLKAAQANCDSEIVVYGGKLLLWTHRNDISPTERTLKMLDSKYAPKQKSLEMVGKEMGGNMSLYTVRREKNKLPEVKMAYTNSSLNPVCEIAKEHVILNVINYKAGKLEIDGVFSIGDFLDKEQINLKVIKEDKEFSTKTEIPVKFSEVYGLNRVFGVTYNRKYQFHVTIPVFALGNKVELHFVTEVNGQIYALDIRTKSVYSHIRHDIHAQYWRFCEEWCLNIAMGKDLFLRKGDNAFFEKKEKEYQKELSRLEKKGNLYAAKALELRKRYFNQYKEYKDKRIWITFDKLYKAGDNGEYMYDYISAQDNNIDMRYLIKNDSPDYERMLKKGDQLLVWGEDDTLLTVLFSEVILTTHTNVISYTGFEKPLIPFICDLFNPINICIQHGLTTQNIAQFQNRLFDNLQLYICASPNEIQNLSRAIYGYTDKSMLRLTGVARYDGLKNNDQKQILITPTWRRNIANSNVAHVKKGHNDYFKNSEYYKIYNRLINDPKLIECAKKTGYKVIYLLHPAASAQINDFDRNDYVDLIPAAGDMDYEKILTESSLMVTDYSGVQFDFAYQRKPLLYYHPTELPPHYDQSEAYIYERDAFGPIIDNHEDIVDALCEYMRNGCVMEQEYVERANRFFAYDDFENCARIYKEILEYCNR